MASMANTVKESAISIKIAVFTIFLSVTSIILGGVTVDYVKPVVAKLIGQQSVSPAAVMLQPQPRPVVESAPVDKIAPTSELSPPVPQTVAPNSDPTLLAEPNAPVRALAVVAPPAKVEPAPAAVMLQPQPRPVVESAPADKIAPTSELSPPVPQTVAPNSDPTLLAEPNASVRAPVVVAPPAKAEPAPAAVMLQPQPRPVVESAPADKIAPTSELSLPTPQTVAPNSEPTLLAEPNAPVRALAVVAPPAKAEPAPAVAAAPKASPLPVQSPKSATAKPATPRAEAAPSPVQLRWEAPRVDPVPPALTRRDGAERRVWERDLAKDAERRNVWRGERLREFGRRSDFPSPRLGREWQGQGRGLNPERFGRQRSRSERW